MKLLDDNPARTDLLGFGRMVKILDDVIADPDAGNVLADRLFLYGR